LDYNIRLAIALSYLSRCTWGVWRRRRRNMYICSMYTLYGRFHNIYMTFAHSPWISEKNDGQKEAYHLGCRWVLPNVVKDTMAYSMKERREDSPEEYLLWRRWNRIIDYPALDGRNS